MYRLALAAPFFLWCVCASAPARAQDAPADSPAHISIVDGAALLERDGQSEAAPASMPLLAGDRVRTQGGRIEILFADGSTLHLDSNTVVDFQSDEVVRLLGGRVRLNIAGAPSRRVAYRVDAPSAWVEIGSTGEYRISVLAGPAGTTDGAAAEVELAVLRGQADLVNEDGHTSLSAGERAFARAGAGPSTSYVFNSASWDAFDRWSESRRDSRLGVSAEYLPETVQSYAATFNEHGYWRNEPTYGQVWYPRVRAGWRPYYYGRWTTLRPWGWTWIGSDPWAWPTHHYGRWGFSAGAWFWIPGRTWGPAWVSWAYAPGYVSWCPLGWNNRPIFGFTNAGVYGRYRHDPWRAWTVVPHRGFGRGYVNVNVVNVTRIDARTRGAFVERNGAPNVTGYAVPRSSVAIRSIGPRGYDGSAVRGSRSGPVGAGDADPAAAFRSRRSSSASPRSGAYPAPAREPRDISTVPAPTRSGTARARSTGVPVAPGARSSPSPSDRAITTPGVRSNPASPSAPEGRSMNERRAVPRSAPPDATRPSATPSRRAPAYRAPSGGSPGGASAPDADRSMPRAERPASRSNGTYAPAPPAAGSERVYRAPSSGAQERGPRASPRTAPERSGPPAGYSAPDGYRSPAGSRSRSGPARSAPAPSPRSAAPASRPSGPPPQSASPSRPSGGGGSRSRGGGQSSGRAVPRGGRQ